MNLMFWKKKPAAGDGAKALPEDAADNAAEQKSPDSESPDSEPQKKLGLFSRIKLRLVSLIRRSKKTPSTDEEEAKEPAAETHLRSTHEPEGHAGIDEESETSEKPGLFARTKLRLAALIGRTPKATEEEEEEAADALRRAKPEAEHATEEAAEEAAKPKHSRKGWIIGGLILLLILLVTGGYFALDYILPPLKRSNIAHETVKAYRIRQQALKDAQQAEPPLSESPQAAPPPPAAFESQQPPVEPVQPAQQRTGSSAPPISSKGEVVVDSKNPKSTAMSLKEAIEVMNAESGGTARKPAR